MEFFSEGKSLVCVIDNFIFALNLTDENQVNDIIEFVQAINENLCPQVDYINRLVFLPYRDDGGDYSVMASNGENNLIYSTGDEKTATDISIFFTTVFSVVNKVGKEIKNDRNGKKANGRANQVS